MTRITAVIVVGLVGCGALPAGPDPSTGDGTTSLSSSRADAEKAALASFFRPGDVASTEDGVAPAKGCDVADCGPALGLANRLCSDGVSYSGPSGRCLPVAGGGCAWEVLSCPAVCVADADCRTFASTCDTCQCLALGQTAADPVCGGSQVECFADSCAGQTAVCDQGQCVLKTACAIIDCAAPPPGCHYEGMITAPCEAQTCGTLICEPPPAETCGGLLGTACADGLVCVDIPDDGCDPDNGGADCLGTCMDAVLCSGLTAKCSSGYTWSTLKCSCVASAPGSL